MAQSIKLTSPEQRELFGLTESLPIGSQQTKTRQTASYRGREETRQLILRACTYRELCLREIAKELNRSKSPELRNMCYELCHDGLLVAKKDTTHNGLVGYKFITARP